MLRIINLEETEYLADNNHFFNLHKKECKGYYHPFAGRELYYHTWEKENSTHYYEIDFLLSKGTKVDPIEVKSSGVGKHESLNAFRKKYSSAVGETIIISQKDLKKEGNLKFVPVYMTTFLTSF